MNSVMLIYYKTKELLTYKINIIVFMFYGLLPLITATFVKNETLTLYYISVFFVAQLVNGWTANQISSDVSSGNLNHLLLMPRPFYYTYFISRLSMLIFLMPLLLFVFFCDSIVASKLSWFKWGGWFGFLTHGYYNSI